MPFNGTGIFQRVYQWVNDASNGIFVDATRTDQDSNDIADGLSNCVTRDGQSPALANLPMGGFKLTGLGTGQNPADAVNFAQAFTAPSFNGGVTIAGGLNVAGGLTSNGVINFTSATSASGPTPPLTDNTTTFATTAWVVQKQFGTALPAQSGNAGKAILTDGTNALWDWAQKVTRSARTANTALAQTDRGTLIDITANTFTQTFTAAATLGNGWYCWIRNGGTGDITLDPNASELIDGLTSYVMYPGEARLVQCDGSAFTSVVIHGFNKTFTATGLFVKPPGYTWFNGELWGGGASGAASNTNATLPAGSGGASSVPFAFQAASFPASATATIGAGGAAVTGTTSGIAGGTSTFNGINSYGGFPGGLVASGSINGGSGASVFGAASVSADVATFGGASGAGISAPNPIVPNGTPGNNCLNGGAGGGSAGATAGAGGASLNGGNGGAAGVNAAASPGAAPGGGGGASYNGDGVSRASGAGARGECRIRGIM